MKILICKFCARPGAAYKRGALCRPCFDRTQSAGIEPVLAKYQQRSHVPRRVAQQQGSSIHREVPESLMDLKIALDNMLDHEYNGGDEAPSHPELLDPPLPAPRREHRARRGQPPDHG